MHAGQMKSLNLNLYFKRINAMSLYLFLGVKSGWRMNSSTGMMSVLLSTNSRFVDPKRTAFAKPL